LSPPFESLGSLRWDIGIGLDSGGDTVAVLPNTVDGFGPGTSVREFGSSYTLTGSGSTYNSYELVFDPNTDTAALWVNGTQVLTDYTGDTSYVGNDGLVVGGVSGGQVNFSFAELTVASSPPPVPEPATGGLIAGTVLLGFSWIHRFGGRRKNLTASIGNTAE